MKKCPKCELNYIEDNAELCNVCVKLLPTVKVASPNSKTKGGIRNYDETFTFTKEKAKLRGKYGYKAYNSKGDNVGIVFMTDDNRISAYGNCELCIADKYHGIYGEWHRIKTNGCPIKWETLCNYLKTHFEYTCYID